MRIFSKSSIAFPLTVCLIFSGCAAPKERVYTDVFAEMTVHEIYVDIGGDGWQSILSDPQAKEYFHADITIDGVEIPDTGFRTRGSSSMRTALRKRSQRYPFRLKFDKYVKGQKWMGLDELVLTNCNDDPSYLRERLGYEAFRVLGGDAPYTAFFNVYINGELHGLYVGVEAVDNSYLDRVFGGHKGNLYEADLQATLLPSMDLELMEQKKGSDDDKSDIAALINTLAAMPEGEKGDIESVIDVDTVLIYLAGNAVLHNWDDYSGRFAHNFYFYNDGGSAATRPLAAKILAVPEYYERYLTYCGRLRDWLGELSGRLPELHDLIAGDVLADPSKFCTEEQFEREFDSSYSSGLAGFIAERCEYLSGRINELTAK